MRCRPFRKAFLQRAAEGLLSAARKVADAGLPVVELVTKIVALVPDLGKL
jgi:hypothetical protein